MGSYKQFKSFKKRAKECFLKIDFLLPLFLKYPLYLVRVTHGAIAKFQMVNLFSYFSLRYFFIVSQRLKSLRLHLLYKQSL